MGPMELEGDTLGKKHQHYNKLVEEALKSSHLQQPVTLSEDDDIQNLVKIDVACRNRNVGFILEILKSEDQLYVSKALKRSSWLFTDPQYANIINPDYIYTVLYPQMTTKAFNKLLLNIRLQLKDENRVEAFYDYVKRIDVKSAYKWLQNCSIATVEKEVANSNDNMHYKMLKRLFKKSFSIYEIHFKKPIYHSMSLQNVFIIKMYTKELLDFLESLKDGLHYRFNKKGTRIIMQRCPEKILCKFHIFAKCLHLATFAKLLKETEDIEQFLLKHADNQELEWLYEYEKIKHFIWQMPKDTRFEFVNKVFIEKEALNNNEENHKYKSITNRAKDKLINHHSQDTNYYVWYKFAPFEIAYPELQKLIRAEPLPLLRNLMLQVMLSTAGRNIKHIKTVLQYYHDKHINEAFKFKIQFVNFFISKVDTHTLDDTSWDMLSQLFHSMEVFIESENNVQSCINAIIVRNTIRNEVVPDIIQSKFIFDTLKIYQRKLKKPEEKDAIFEYLRNFIDTRNNSLNLAVESEFNEAVTLSELLLNLLKDWQKKINEYAYAIDRVKELVKFKKENFWNHNLTALYNTTKSWRKTMFQESIDISPTENVCINALKHYPVLLSHNKELVLDMCCYNNLSFGKLLKKIRIYWPQTLAKDWKIAYLKRLDQPGKHKTFVIGLCTLLPSAQINDLLQKYAPSGNKIDSKETDQHKLSLRKQILKNIHRARPPPPLDGILLYAKRDYLKYAFPSINAMLNRFSPDKSRLYIPMLLNTPISLKKIGLRCAIRKLSSDELKPLLCEIWSSTKNSSIRTVLFTQIFQVLCKEKNGNFIQDKWELLSMFIDKLTAKDNKLIFDKLGAIYKVPESIAPHFFIKAYTILSSLPTKNSNRLILNQIQYIAIEYAEYFHEDFVNKVLLKDIHNFIINDNTFFRKEGIIPSFILASKDEETQIKRYETSLKIILEHCLLQWEMVYENQYYFKQYAKKTLQNLVGDLGTYTYEKKFHIPLTVFEKILWKLENTLSYQKDYVLLTTWKLATKYVKLLTENTEIFRNDEINIYSNIMTEEKTKMYQAYHDKISPLFVKVCIQYLKEDTMRFGNAIHSLFGKAVKDFLVDYLTTTMCPFEHRILFQKHLLQSENDRAVSLMVYNILVFEIGYFYYYHNSEELKIFKEVYDVVEVNCNDEIKIYFYQAFATIAQNF